MEVTLLASHPNPQPGGPEYPFFVLVITFELSGMGGPTRSYTSADIVLRIIGPHKPHCCDKVEMPSGGMLCVY